MPRLASLNVFHTLVTGVVPVAVSSLEKAVLVTAHEHITQRF
jgi:hypothetical protein